MPRLQLGSTSRVNHLCQGSNYGLLAEQTIFAKAPTMVYQQSKPSITMLQLWSTSRVNHICQGSNMVYEQGNVSFFQDRSYDLPAEILIIFSKTTTMVYLQSNASPLPRLLQWTTYRVLHHISKTTTMVYQQSKLSLPRLHLWSTIKVFIQYVCQLRH